MLAAAPESGIAGLVAHWQAVVEWEDGDRHGLHKLGEAYVLNGEPAKTIELLSEPYRRSPDDPEFQFVILDALFALGKDETDFEWVECMPVFRLDDSSFLDRCHAYLKPKRSPSLPVRTPVGRARASRPRRASRKSQVRSPIRPRQPNEALV